MLQMRNGGPEKLGGGTQTGDSGGPGMELSLTPKLFPRWWNASPPSVGTTLNYLVMG